MRTPRLAGLGLAATATAALALAGCANGDATPAASAPAPATGSSAPASASAADPNAVAALTKATEQLGTTSFKVTATSGQGFKLTGAIDPAKGVGTADLSATGTNADLNIKTLLIEQDLYLQVPGFTKAGTWTHVDVARLPEGANVGLRPGQIDPVNTSNLLGSATDVRATGTNTYAGSLDVTKAAGLAGVSQVTVDGTQAQKVPFTAQLDDQGRLSTLTIEIANAQPLEVRYSDYGTPVTAARPAASEITEAPDSLYQSLGS
ncbi:hypothetical protein Ade02nite_85430 [Paractinoplanes deccanensis]|uniref:Lipoprotein LprG n=1 Tax=Paractinoplanes deccanensis TaxID=113561 RepID=A0ABQ3YIT3_9ACTN|nr:hypothetical protein [Actinoplanes deccanensis]GID79902.1 hypothetical protein Ade02nite_85430 [Actinoplanes deccanensis]